MKNKRKHNIGDLVLLDTISSVNIGIIKKVDNRSTRKYPYTVEWVDHEDCYTEEGIEQLKRDLRLYKGRMSNGQ